MIFTIFFLHLSLFYFTLLHFILFLTMNPNIVSGYNVLLLSTLHAKSVSLFFQAASSWLHIVPWGIRKLVKHVKDKYGDTPVIITENGEYSVVLWLVNYPNYIVLDR